MKIIKFKQAYKNNDLVKLKTLKVYSKTKQTTVQNFLLETHLLKICNTNYQYHLLNKKILFLGMPANFKKFLKNTKHKLIPESLLFNGILSNKEFINNTIKTKLINIDLIIIYNQNPYLKLEKESNAARIPTIILNHEQKFTNRTTYSGLNSDQSFNDRKRTNNFFLFFLQNALFKAKQSKSIIKTKAQYYLILLLRSSKQKKLSYLSKVQQKNGLYILYELIYNLKKYNKYE